jgi:hypothetical protein
VHFGIEKDTSLDDLVHADQVLDSALDDDEVVLWFEADLFDQAILIYLLTRLADVRERLRLVTLHEYPGVKRFIGLGQLSASQLAGLFPARIPVTHAMIDAAQEAWAAWAAPTPELLAALAARASPALPYLRPAVHRVLQELPDARSGLSRTERQGLEALRAGATSLHESFSVAQDREERPWAGDGMYFANMHALANGAAPLIVAEGGWPSVSDARRNPRMALTPLAYEVLDGRADWWPRSGRTRWVAGTVLGAGTTDWRWDAHRGLVHL